MNTMADNQQIAQTSTKYRFQPTSLSNMMKATQNATIAFQFELVLGAVSERELFPSYTKIYIWSKDIPNIRSILLLVTLFCNGIITDSRYDINVFRPLVETFRRTQSNVVLELDKNKSNLQRPQENILTIRVGIPDDNYSDTVKRQQSIADGKYDGWKAADECLSQN